MVARVHPKVIVCIQPRSTPIRAILSRQRTCIVSAARRDVYSPWFLTLPGDILPSRRQAVRRTLCPLDAPANRQFPPLLAAKHNQTDRRTALPRSEPLNIQLRTCCFSNCGSAACALLLSVQVVVGFLWRNTCNLFLQVLS